MCFSYRPELVCACLCTVCASCFSVMRREVKLSELYLSEQCGAGSPCTPCHPLSVVTGHLLGSTGYLLQTSALLCFGICGMAVIKNSLWAEGSRSSAPEAGWVVPPPRQPLAASPVQCPLGLLRSIVAQVSRSRHGLVMLVSFSSLSACSAPFCGIVASFFPLPLILCA